MRLLPVTVILLVALVAGCRDSTIIATGHSPADTDSIDSNPAGSDSVDTDTAPLLPRLRVDLNMIGRAEDETNEPDYTPWTIEKADTVSRDFDGISVTLARTGDAGSFLTTAWYKAGVQPPVLARLANDGVIVADGDVGAQIEIPFRGCRKEPTPCSPGTTRWTIPTGSPLPP